MLAFSNTNSNTCLWVWHCHSCRRVWTCPKTHVLPSLKLQASSFFILHPGKQLLINYSLHLSAFANDCLLTHVFLHKLVWLFMKFCTPRGAGVHPSAFAAPLSIHFLIFCSLLLFPFFLFSFTLYLFFSIVHLIPFYQNRPTPFPGERS